MPSRLLPAIAASSETETTVENEMYKIVFTNRGAQVKHWILKKYTDTSGKPLDMVQPQLAARFGLPLSFFTYDPALTTQLNQALYQVTVSGPQASDRAGAGACHAHLPLRAEWRGRGKDLPFRHKLRDRHRRAGAAQRAACARAGRVARAAWATWRSSFPHRRRAVRCPLLRRLSGLSTASRRRSAAAKVSGNATLDQPFQYAAVTDLYFAAAFLPDNPSDATLVTLHHSVDLPSDLSNPNSQKKADSVLGLAMGDTSGDTRLRLYAGPKQMEVLKTIHAMGPDGKPDGPTLEPLIQYGMWTVIAKPLYLALRLLRNLLGAGPYNWGWAIIIITVIFNLVLLPTRFMMMKSSLKMMRIQPKVEALKKRYAHLKVNDPKRAEMNTEMMQLYKTEGVNMYGGCLPMLLQMPLFFAYYKVLLNAVELRQAHWFWLHDLSAPDPLHILPALIIVTMFLVQYITPSPGMDPTQRRMMAFMMPVFMGFILWHYASGLALYWITGNIINLAIQVGINQSSIGKEMHAIAARRAQKKSSSTARG